MIHAPLADSHTHDLRKFASDTIKCLLRAVARTADDETLKACIMTAHEHGHLTDEEAAFFINAWGVRSA